MTNEQGAQTAVKNSGQHKAAASHGRPAVSRGKTKQTQPAAVQAFLTAAEIEKIEKLDASTIGDFIKNFSDEKKQLVMKQYGKECTLKLWKGIAKEKY